MRIGLYHKVTYSVDPTLQRKKDFFPLFSQLSNENELLKIPDKENDVVINTVELNYRMCCVIMITNLERN